MANRNTPQVASYRITRIRAPSRSGEAATGFCVATLDKNQATDGEIALSARMPSRQHVSRNASIWEKCVTGPAQRSELSSLPENISNLKSGELWRLRPGAILDKLIRVSNAARDLPSTIEWLRFLSELERRNQLPCALPDTVAKPFRTFAVHRLSMRERCRLLCAHYRIAAAMLPQELFEALWVGSRIPLGLLCGRTGKKYCLILEPSGHSGREGEYAFSLSGEDGIELAKLTFTIAHGLDGRDETQLLIGGLQGPPSFFGPGSKQRVVAATRDLSGLRPKMAVFVAASTFANAVGASSLMAVSNRTHSINSDAWYQRRRLVADYDAFWVERDGRETRHGFQIPLTVAPRSNRSARNEQRCRVGDLVNQVVK